MSEEGDYLVSTDDAVSSAKSVHTYEMTSNEVEKLEEAKLKAKYPMANTGGLSGHSAFLQKKLAKGTKYFDSGDYQMARQTLPNLQQKSKLIPSITSVLMRTGEAIPTPESVPVRKTSIIQTKYQQTTVPGTSNPSPPPT